MTETSTGSVCCQICGQQLERSQAIPASLVRTAVAETIQKERPDWSADGFICNKDLNLYRAKHVEDVLEAEKGEISALESDVLESLRQRELLAQNVEAAFAKAQTFGGRVADRVAEFGGSWGFIGCFFAVMFVWIVMNVRLLARPFDPYPFILLNLALSCMAGIQAPVIMMSQNRQEAKDRMRAENDYKVNLKAEIEVHNLDAKMDLLLTSQWQRLLEIQQIQTEMMGELMRHMREAG